jgi:GH24 family phage-related lysozyme (muramidase)
MDAATLALIKRFEGSKPVGWDYKQYSGPYGVKIAPGERIDLGEAERRLQAEVAPIGGHLDKAFGGVTMTPQQRSALTSFTYNVGPGWMSSPTRLASAVRSGDWNSAASVMREYNKAGGKVLPGLVNRRDQEARMLLGGPMPETGAQPEPGLPPLSMKSFVGQAGAETPAPVPRETSPAPSMLGAPPMAEPEQSPFNSFIERFQSPMTQQGLGLLMAAMQGGDLNAGASAGAQRGNMALQQYLAIQKQRQEQQKRQQVEQMIGGMTDIPEQARNFARVTGDTGVIEKYLTAQAGGGQTADIKEYEYARKNGFQGSLQDWLVSKRASQGEYAKQPTYGVVQDGNPVLLQLGTRGDAVPTKLPEGVRMQRDPIKMDAGTKYILLDPTTRQVIGEVPKNLAEKEIEVGDGQDVAKARAAIPSLTHDRDYAPAR